MANEIRMCRFGKLSGHQDVAIIDDHCVAVDTPWRLSEMRVHVSHLQWWGYVLTTAEGRLVDIRKLVIIGAEGPNVD